MKTTTINVGGLLSPLCAQDVEKQLCKMPGVKRADVNFVSGSTTVEYDESATNLDRIKRCIRACGYRCSSEMLPEHVCTANDPPGDAGTAAAVLSGGHESHARTPWLA
jgi:P-type Cu2+ transporter